MTALTVLAFIAFLWIAHGFWCDYKEANRPRTEEEQAIIRRDIQALELELFHKRLYLQDLACPWEPTYKPEVKIYHNPSSYTLGQGNLIDLNLQPLSNLMFISAEAKLAYLKSPEWYILKNQRLKIAQDKCEVCGSKRQLKCHHITYERLTRERIDDLVILCGGSNGCHQKIHDILGYSRTTEYPISILKDYRCQ